MEANLDPILAYTAGAEINQLQWSSTQPDWVAIAFSSKLQILRVWAPYLCHSVITGFHSWITAKALKVCGLTALASAISEFRICQVQRGLWVEGSASYIKGTGCSFLPLDVLGCWGKPGNGIFRILPGVSDPLGQYWAAWTQPLDSLFSGRTNFCSHVLVPLVCWSDFLLCSSWSFQLVSCRARWWSSQEIIYLGSMSGSSLYTLVCI